jgi:hypothetical protein
LAPIWPSPTREAEEAREARLKFLKEYVVPEAAPLPDAPVLDWDYKAPPPPKVEPDVIDLLPPRPVEPISPFAPKPKPAKPEDEKPAPAPPPPRPAPRPPAREVKIVVRLPSGKRIDRVFKRAQKGQDIFEWVSSQGAAELMQGSTEKRYSLSAGPAKLQRDKTLEAQGIDGPMLMTVFID